jgi:hypothetical protein
MGQPVISRVTGGAFFNRQPQLDKLFRAATGPAPRTVLVLGQPQSGRTELLRTTWDLLFSEAHQALPIYFQPQPEQMQPQRLAHDFLFTLLRQYLAFIHRQPELIGAVDLTPGSLLSLTGNDEFAVIRNLLDGYEARLASGNEYRLLRYVFTAPLCLAAHTPHRLVLMLDEAQLLNQVVANEQTLPLLSEILRELRALSLIITGLQRALLEQWPVDRELISELWLEWLDPLDLPVLQALARHWAAVSGIELDPEIARLMAQQLDGNLFYLRSLLTAAGEHRLNLTNAIELERLYVDELLRGRIAHHFSTLLRRLARHSALGARGERAATDIVGVCYEAIEARAPVEIIERKLSRNFHAARLLAELHHHELITLLDDHVLPSDDPVFRDWLAATQQRFSGILVSQVTLDLLRRRLAAAPQMLLACDLRTLHRSICDLLSRFDRQSIARSLVEQDRFLTYYGSATYHQILSGLNRETDRLTLPQIIYVTETPLTSGDETQNLPPWSCIIAYGFDAAICDNDHETVWVVAVNNSPTAITEACVAALDQHLERFRDPLSSGKEAPCVVRWAISKMGFTSQAGAALRERDFLTADYLQLELFAETIGSAPRVGRAASVPVEIRRPDRTRDFDLAIPIGEDREIIAARVVEQIARSAGFAPEALNQLKTALIEACLSLSAIGSSTDGRLYLRFHSDHGRMTITAASSAVALDQPGGVIVEDDPEGVWRLNILGSLVDEATLTRLVSGFRITLTKKKAPRH